MFRRRWSGLPADPVFIADLKELGYFVNDMDEIRSIDDSDHYFKYYLTKNNRWNDRQRFAFNRSFAPHSSPIKEPSELNSRTEAIAKIILTRLTVPDTDKNNPNKTNHAFTVRPLPLGTPTTSPHVPILTSPNIATTSRIILLFGESAQSLGVLAHRVIGGRGGISKGSVLGLVSALKTLQSSATDASPPGVVLANTGELWWWPEGGMGLTPTERHDVPMASAVHLGRWHDKAVNEVEGHRNVDEHVKSVFEQVVMNENLVNGKAKVDVIAVGDASDAVEKYLDGEERGRAYVIHHTPLDTPVAGPGGNPGAAGFTFFGCPVYSAGNAQLTETMLIEAQPAVLNWIQQAALEGEAYKNEEFELFGEEGTVITTEELDSPWGTETTGAAESEKVVGEKGRKDVGGMVKETEVGTGGAEKRIEQEAEEKMEGLKLETEKD
ncbi:hypothetical protein N0V88_003783 [Collariella sp. IMI 366227]|nr:hypothetical protein N0V88_003783 [Collariella sp. IMI 366227]